MTKKKTLFFTEGGGRFGNQYLTDMHFFAFQQDYPEIQFFNAKIAPYIHLLQDHCHNYPSSIRCMNRFGRILGKIDRRLSNIFFVWIEKFLWAIFSKKNDQTIFVGDYYRKSNIYPTPLKEIILNENFVQSLNDKPFKSMALRGRPINNWDLFLKHADILRDNFRLSKNFYTRSEILLEELRGKYDWVVGVAMRQTDYITYNDLGYYITTPEYVEMINQLRTYFADKGKVAFVIASDEQQDLNKFPKDCFLAPGHIGGDGHYLEDMTALELSDVIAGPPSTFSFSACFNGDTPYIILLKGMTQSGFSLKTYRDVVGSQEMLRVIQ